MNLHRPNARGISFSKLPDSITYVVFGSEFSDDEYREAIDELESTILHQKVLLLADLSKSRKVHSELREHTAQFFKKVASVSRENLTMAIVGQTELIRGMLRVVSWTQPLLFRHDFFSDVASAKKWLAS